MKNQHFWAHLRSIFIIITVLKNSEGKVRINPAGENINIQKLENLMRFSEIPQSLRYHHANAYSQNGGKKNDGSGIGAGTGTDRRREAGEDYAKEYVREDKREEDIKEYVREDKRERDIEGGAGKDKENGKMIEKMKSNSGAIDKEKKLDLPHFDENSPRITMAALGSPAHIPCSVRNLGSKSVSWIRHRDLHVLTVGSFTFTNDDRFSAHRDPITGDWVLVLRHPKTSDSGKYECSISTKPVISQTVKLNVVVPASEMVGKSHHLYIDQGSSVNLTCVVRFSPTPPEFILWYHEDKLVDYAVKGRVVSVETTHQDDTTFSRLRIFNATMQDNGHYSCKPSNARKVSARVHVLRSEIPAAMQTTTTNNSQSALKPFNIASGYMLPSMILISHGLGISEWYFSR